MKKFLKNSPLNKIQLPIADNQKRFFNPIDVPLLDFIAADSRRVDVWNMPSIEYLSFMQENRGMSLSMLGRITVQEIIVGETSATRIKEIEAWMWDKFKENQEEMPTNVMSLDVEEIQMTYYDELKLSGKLPQENNVLEATTELETDMLVPGEMDRNIQLPLRIMLGDGLRWALMITIRAELSKYTDEYGKSKKVHMIPKFKVQPEVLELIRKLPVVTGVGIKNDVKLIEEHYSIISGEPVNMASFIELGSLLVLAGWRAINANMPIINAIIVGTIINKMSSCGDGLWGHQWDQLDNGLQVYALMDIKHGYIVYNIVMAALMRDLFPDPEGVCYATFTSQRSFAAWFLEWIAAAITGTEVDYRALESSVSREESMRSLRTRDIDGVLTHKAPDRVEAVIELVGDWPTLPYGGCRYLHQARFHFISQYKFLQRIPNTESLGLFAMDLSPGILRHISFGVPELRQVNWRSELRVEGLGLRRHGELARPRLVVEPEVMSGMDILKEAGVADRPMKEGVLEWAREDLSRVERFFSRMEENEEFRKFFLGTYDDLRFLFTRASGLTSPVVISLEGFLEKRNREVTENEIRLRDLSREETRIREGRVDFCLNATKDKDLGQRTGWEQDMPRLPKRPKEWIPRYQPRLIPETETSGSGSIAPGGRRGFAGHSAVMLSLEKRDKDRRNRGVLKLDPICEENHKSRRYLTEKFKRGVETDLRSVGENRICRYSAEKVCMSSRGQNRSRSSSRRVVRREVSPDLPMSTAKDELVRRVRSRYRSPTPGPSGSNRIIDSVMMEEREHPSLGRYTAASKKRKRNASSGRPARIFTYDEMMEPSHYRDEDLMDPDEYVESFEFKY